MYNDILWIPQRDRVGPGYEFMDDLQPPMCYQDRFIFPNLTRPYMPPLQYHHDSLDTSHTGPDWNLIPYTLIVIPTSAPKTPTKASPASLTKHHPDFSTREYLGLANAVIMINPFGVKHGQKGAKWKEVSKALKAEKLFPKSSTDTIKNKMIALLKYHKVQSRTIKVDKTQYRRKESFWRQTDFRFRFSDLENVRKTPSEVFPTTFGNLPNFWEV